MVPGFVGGCGQAGSWVVAGVVHLDLTEGEEQRRYTERHWGDERRHPLHGLLYVGNADVNGRPLWEANWLSLSKFIK